MSKKEKGKWDGRSRIPTETYKHNYNEIFRNKKETNKELKRNKWINIITTTAMMMMDLLR